MKLLFWLIVVSSFIGAGVVSIDLGYAQLSLFRGSLLLMSLHLLCSYFYRGKALNLAGNHTQAIAVRFYFFWFTYSFFSLGWVQDYQSWFRATFFIGSGFLSIWVSSHYLKSKSNIVNYFTVMFVMLIVHNIIGWSEMLTGIYRFADVSRFDRYDQFLHNPLARVPISMFGNPNNFATFLVFGVFICCNLFNIIRSRVFKVVTVLTMISSVTLIVKTHSRANILALLLGIFTWAYMRYFRRLNFGALILVVAVSITLLSFPSIFDNMLAVLSNELSFSLSHGSEFIRLNLLRNGLRFFIETFGFGTGAGNIEYWMVHKAKFYVGGVELIHNWWAEILVGYGLFVFIGYVIVYIRMAIALYHSYLKSNDKFFMSTSLSLFCVMIAFSISAVSSSSNISAEWLWLFWGVVITYIGLVERTVDTVDYHGEVVQID